MGGGGVVGLGTSVSVGRGFGGGGFGLSGAGTASAANPAANTSGNCLMRVRMPPDSRRAVTSTSSSSESSAIDYFFFGFRFRRFGPFCAVIFRRFGVFTFFRFFRVFFPRDGPADLVRGISWRCAAIVCCENPENPPGGTHVLLAIEFQSPCVDVLRVSRSFRTEQAQLPPQCSFVAASYCNRLGVLIHIFSCAFLPQFPHSYAGA